MIMMMIMIWSLGNCEVTWLIRIDAFGMGREGATTASCRQRRTRASARRTTKIGPTERGAQKQSDIFASSIVETTATTSTLELLRSTDSRRERRYFDEVDWQQNLGARTRFEVNCNPQHVLPFSEWN